MNVAVKICGIKTPEMARFCAKAGAQFIGIVLHPESPRYVEFDDAYLIAKAAKEAGIIPVAVFVDADKDVITNLCAQAEIDHVQLHGDKARAAAPYLPVNIHKIYVVHEQVPEARTNEDYLLFDSPQPGTGQKIDWSSIKPFNNMRIFLAGGLNAQNVIEAIKIVKPFGVDVSSGVESSRGLKSEALIQAFIKQVQHA
ncbi:MAG: phosphoribosylanthranilate isomerase [Legionellales bacterium]|jgi:phosphoribosylanthranilate isomerase